MPFMAFSYIPSAASVVDNVSRSSLLEYNSLTASKVASSRYCGFLSVSRRKFGKGRSVGNSVGGQTTFARAGAEGIDMATSQITGTTEDGFIEDMKCDGAKAIQNKLDTFNDFLVPTAVAEFKGPKIFGVVRFAQVNVEFARVEANFGGLSPGSHVWSVNEFGDLTKGATSTGQIFDPSIFNSSLEKPLGYLGILNVGDNEEAVFSGMKYMLKVADVIGRSVVLYDTEDMSGTRTAAAVIARSAGVEQNYKKICACDGSVIWESANSNLVKA
eukprot:Gb_17137 [translate_table: standard]